MKKEKIKDLKFIYKTASKLFNALFYISIAVVALSVMIALIVLIVNVPTEEMLTNERESLISYYKTLYMSQNGLNEQTALDTATEFVNNLGETYVYENVMYTLVEEFLYTKATVNKVEKTYTSITETIAKNEAVTQ